MMPSRNLNGFFAEIGILVDNGPRPSRASHAGREGPVTNGVERIHTQPLRLRCCSRSRSGLAPGWPATPGDCRTSRLAVTARHAGQHVVRLGVLARFEAGVK